MGGVIALPSIANRIFSIRGTRVLLSADLAALYEVETKVLVQAVRRNIERFPADFMFQLTWEETARLRSQIVTLKNSPEGAPSRRGRHLKYQPFAFTEQGVAMLSTVLRSRRAIEVNIEVMRAFVRLREVASSHHELARKLATLEKKYDARFRVVFEAIEELMTPIGADEKKQIGFQSQAPQGAPKP
jgi:hypothetical protein